MSLNLPNTGKLKIVLGRNNETFLLFTHGLFPFFSKTDYRGRKNFRTNDYSENKSSFSNHKVKIYTKTCNNE